MQVNDCILLTVQLSPQNGGKHFKQSFMKPYSVFKFAIRKGKKAAIAGLSQAMKLAILRRYFTKMSTELLLNHRAQDHLYTVLLVGFFL